MIRSQSSSSCADFCSVAVCRLKCSLEVVDELLSTPGAVSGDELDLLLDFRSLLRAGTDAEGTLRMFCDLRRRLEQRHYLAFYRIRRWLENHINAEVSGGESTHAQQLPLRLNFYCVEAIRRSCLCAALQQNSGLPITRLRFVFMPAANPIVPNPVGMFDLAYAD